MWWTGEDTGKSHLRASDSDRDRVAAAIAQHLVKGRISVDEVDQRLESVFRARTVGELLAVTRDLPDGPSRPALSALPRIQVRRHLPLDFYIHVGNFFMVVGLWVLVWSVSGGPFWPAWLALAWLPYLCLHAKLAKDSPLRTRRAEPQR
jgi:hypothetical protein